MNNKIQIRIPSALARTRSVSFALAAVMALAAPLAEDGAKAQTVCVDGGATITCTGSGSTPISYTERNVVLTLDGTATPMTVPAATLLSNTSSSTDPMSIVTKGQVTLVSENGNPTVQAWRMGGGDGDVSIKIGGETVIERPVQMAAFGTTYLVHAMNYVAGDVRVEIAEGARLSDASIYQGIGVSAQASGGGATLINAGDFSAIAGRDNSYYYSAMSAGGQDTVSNPAPVYAENSGTIVVRKAPGAGAFDGGTGLGVGGSYAYHAGSVTAVNTGLIDGPVTAAGDSFVGIDASVYNYVLWGSGLAPVTGHSVLVINEGDIRGVSDGIIARASQGSFMEVRHSAGEIAARDHGIWVDPSGTSFLDPSLPLSEAKVTSGGRIITEEVDSAKGIFVGGGYYSGGIIALGLAQINQVAGGEIINRGTGDDTAAIYVTQTEQVEIGVSGKLRTEEGSAIYAQEVDRQYVGKGPANGAPYVLEGGGGNFTFDILAGGDVMGGGKLSGSGIKTVGGDSSKVTVHQGGSLGAMSDVAVRAVGYTVPALAGYDYTLNQSVVMPSVDIAPAPTDITNAGTITGVFKLGNAQNAVANAASGTWNLRAYADSTANGTRDYLSVAITDLGSGGNNTVTNDGLIRLLGRDGQDPTILDVTGEYLPNGNLNNAMTVKNRIQAQILGANTFINNGVIDMTGNAEAGDVLVITGGQTAGVNGGGTFVTGGSILMNTVLNEGGANSQSDVLVVDNVRIGTSASQLIVSGTGSGAQTVGNGILLVQVLGQSPSGAFLLGNRVAAGAYEYTLHQGSTDGNWYLTSDYTGGGGGGGGGGGSTPAYRVEVPVAASIPPLAIEYGYAMLGTLHERVGETFVAESPVAYEERVVRDKDGRRREVRVPVQQEAQGRQQWFSGGWARLIGDRGFHDNNNFAKRGPDYDYTFGGIQAGLDVYGRETAGGGFDKAGFYAGYGQIDANVDGAYGGKAGSVDMDVYTLGAYWTHKDAQGWYTDAVVQSSWYSTDARSIKGQRLKPDGFGFAASLEGGYAFKLSGGLTFEPQAQFIYQYTTFDDVGDNYGRFSLDNGDSLRGRVGGRLAKTWNAASEAQPRLVTAWVRANLWHEFMGSGKTTTTDLYGTNAVAIPSSLQGTWGEVGAGLTGQISDTVTLFGTGAYNQSLDNKGRKAWTGRLGATVKW